MSNYQSFIKDLDGDLIKATSQHLEKVLGITPKIELKDFADADLSQVKSVISDKAIAIELVTADGTVISYLAGSHLLKDVTGYLEQQDESQGEMPEELEKLLDVAEQISASTQKIISAKFSKELKFENPTVQVWPGSSRVSFVNASATFYSVKIGEKSEFNVVRVMPNSFIESIAGAKMGSDEGKVRVSTKQFDELTFDGNGSDISQSISFLSDLELDITAELGRTRMLLRDILKLGKGSLLELDKFAGDPVDLYVNKIKFAEGEVVVIDQNFAIRITSLIPKEERLSIAN